MEDYIEDFENRPRPNILRRIQLRWNHDWKYIPKEFKRGIKKIWYWLPIIWKDRDWDGHYIFEVLKHKLKAQAKYIGDRDFHTRAQQDARNMRLCVRLIEKIQDEYYQMEYMDYAKNRHWFSPSDKEGYVQWNSDNIWEKYEEYYKKYPLIHKRVLKGEGPFTLDGRDEKEIKKVVAMNIAHINHDRARKLLFKIMEEGIEGWWD